MTPLEKQVTTLLGLTGTLNLLDAIEHVKALKHLLKTTEQQRKDWADMCIKKQTKIEKLAEVLRRFCDCPESVIENPEIILDAIGKPISSETLAWAEEVIEKYEAEINNVQPGDEV